VADISSVPHPVIVAGVAAVCLGVPIGLYALLTTDQRRVTRAIRQGAARRGWRFRSRSGGFRIEGPNWIMTSGNSGEGERRWSCEVDVRFPGLSGQPDIAIVPRGGKPLPAIPRAEEIEARIAHVSGTLAAASEFLRSARKMPLGVAEFDLMYEVKVTRNAASPVDEALAARILHWPIGTVAPHSMIAWRDPSGFHCKARLPQPPTLETIEWLAGLAEDCAARVPAGRGES
jgi:hypothetical protein